MHIEIHGRGPALVMLHGWAMHGGIFLPLIEQLSSRYTLYLVDLPGHGRSAQSEYKLDVASCAQYIVSVVPSAIWLGWSLGGLIAQHAARFFSSQVQGLILIATSPKFVSAEDWPYGFEPRVFSQFALDLQNNWRAAMDRFLALECHGSDTERADLRQLRTHIFDHGEPTLGVLEDGLKILEKTDLRHELPQIMCPSLWLAGARDRLVPASAMQWSAAQMRRADYQCVAGGGHAPFLGHPKTVLEVLEPWLSKTFTHEHV
jgi:pimeloyl-[acyl-carrier protein] methyl ester esterase